MTYLKCCINFPKCLSTMSTAGKCAIFPCRSALFISCFMSLWLASLLSLCCYKAHFFNLASVNVWLVVLICCFQLLVGMCWLSWLNPYAKEKNAIHWHPVCILVLSSTGFPNYCVSSITLQWTVWRCAASVTPNSIIGQLLIYIIVQCINESSSVVFSLLCMIHSIS